jgi:hypothetical protein
VPLLEAFCLTKAQYYKTIYSAIYEFLYQGRVFVRLGWKSLPGTNTLACYQNSQITDKKHFITLTSVKARLGQTFLPRTNNVTYFPRAK